MVSIYFSLPGSSSIPHDKSRNDQRTHRVNRKNLHATNTDKKTNCSTTKYPGIENTITVCAAFTSCRPTQTHRLTSEAANNKAPSISIQ